MPIRKKDRTFQNIVRELEIKSIPTEFVQSLTLVCENNDRITFDQETLDSIDQPGPKDLISSLIKLVEEADDLQSQVVDVEIVIDYKKLESDVNARTEKLLKK
jgi:hypothetical protein